MLFSRIATQLINLIIILLAVSPAFALNEETNRNNLLIVAMCFSPLILLSTPIIKRKVDIPLIILCGMIILFPALFHPETIRWTTMIYSCLFILFCLALSHTLSISRYTNENFLKVIKNSFLPTAYLFSSIILLNVILNFLFVPTYS